MPDQESLLRLVDRIYQAAVEPGCWSLLVEELRRELNAVAVNVNLLLPGAKGGDCAEVFGSGFDPALLERYPEEWSAHDIWVERIRGLPAGTVASTAELIAIPEFRKRPIFHEFCVPQQISGDGFVAVLERDRGLFGVHRAEHARAPFGDEERALVQALAPHLMRAYQVRKKLVLAEARAERSEGAVDELPFALILLDEAGAILRANRCAAALLEAGDGLSREGPRLRASSPRDDAALGKAVHDALATSAGGGLSAGAALTLRRPSGRRGLAVMVAPLSRMAPLLGEAGGCAAVFVIDPTTRAAPPDLVLQRMFGLTPAECRIALSLAAGLSPKEAAHDLSLATPTVRSHLRSILTKTGVDGQVALARLLARLAVLPGA